MSDNNKYEKYSPEADKLLQPDGSIITRSGALVEPASAGGAELYGRYTPQVDKLLQPDGTVLTRSEIGGGSGSGGGVSEQFVTNAIDDFVKNANLSDVPAKVTFGQVISPLSFADTQYHYFNTSQTLTSLVVTDLKIGVEYTLSMLHGNGVMSFSVGYNPTPGTGSNTSVLWLNGAPDRANGYGASGTSTFRGVYTFTRVDGNTVQARWATNQYTSRVVADINMISAPARINPTAINISSTGLALGTSATGSNNWENIVINTQTPNLTFNNNSSAVAGIPYRFRFTTNENTAVPLTWAVATGVLEWTNNDVPTELHNGEILMVEYYQYNTAIAYASYAIYRPHTSRENSEIGGGGGGEGGSEEGIWVPYDQAFPLFVDRPFNKILNLKYDYGIWLANLPLDVTLKAFILNTGFDDIEISILAFSDSDGYDAISLRPLGITSTPSNSVNFTLPLGAAVILTTIRPSDLDAVVYYSIDSL
jgi:hypothetical protein